MFISEIELLFGLDCFKIKSKIKDVVWIKSAKKKSLKLIFCLTITQRKSITYYHRVNRQKHYVVLLVCVRSNLDLSLSVNVPTLSSQICFLM